MSDLSRRVDEARGAVQLHWSPERAASLEFAMRRRARRRVHARIAVAAVACVMSIAISLRLVQLRPVSNAVATASAATAWEPLPDGSRVARTTNATRFSVRSTPDATVVHLDRGRATFDVVHRADRVFRVEAGSTAVLVLGTMFTVERTATSAIVSVTDGRVRVLAPNRTADLARGESIVIAIGDDAHPARASTTTAEGDVTPDEPITVPAREPAHPPHERTATRAPREGVEVTDWRALARHGDFDGAYAAIASAPPRAVNDEPADLLLAADSARLSHHASEAVTYLRAVLDRHAGDARAPLAAFALGRVLLDDLGNPREAADAFARAQRLDPSGALVEDALAREVEALSRAGDATAAHAAAARYIDRFPQGRRLAAVRRFGGIEP